MADELTGLQKAAVVLLSLGEDEAAEVLRHLGPRDVQKLGANMAVMEKFPDNSIDQVIKDFRRSLEGQSGFGIGSDEYLRNMLNKALGPDKAGSVIERILHGGEAAGLESLKWMDARSVAELIRLEHPQVVAMVLAYMDPDQASEVLPHLNERLRYESMLRLATLETVQPQALKELNEVLEEQLASEATAVQTASIGGVKPAAEVLNKLDASILAGIMDQIKEQDEELAQKIMDQMFVFEDLVNVDDRGIQTILKDVPADTLILALRGASPEMREKVFRNMSKRAAEMLREDLEAKGPVKLSEVEGAQKEILAVANRLEAAGQITLGGAGAEPML